MSKHPEAEAALGARTAMRYGILALVLAGFATSIGLGIDMLSEGDDLVKQLLAENVLWAATQAHAELLRLQNALLVLAGRADAAAVQDVQFRIDILWSRIDLLTSGEVGSFLAAAGLDGQASALSMALSRLGALAPALTDPGAASFQPAIEEALGLVTEDIGAVQAWTLEVLHADRERLLALMEGRTGVLSWFVLAFSGLVLTGAMFAGLLIREIGTTQRKSQEANRALASAAAAERRLADAIEAIPEGFALYDADDRLAVFNNRYQAIYAESAPAIRIGSRFEDIIRYGAMRGQYTEAVGREEEWIRERVERHRNPGAPIEQSIANNRWLRIEERLTSEGGVVGVRVDITDIKHAQHLLQRAERAANLGHFTLNASTGEVQMSAQLCRILDVRAPGGVGTLDSLMAGFESAEGGNLSDMLTLVSEKGRKADTVLRTRRVDGSRRSVRVLLDVETDAEGAIFGTLQDITLQHEAEQRLAKATAAAEAANAAKGRFLSIMSHEIRTPMNGVVGALNLIDVDRLDPAVAEMIEVARSGTDRLRSVLNDILDFSRIESGRLALEAGVFDPRAFAGEAIAFWAGAAAVKGLALRSDVGAEVAPALVGDVGRLRQVVDNLLSNAIKYTPAGTVVLGVHGEPSTDPAMQRLVIAVADTGVGIADEDRGKVFVDFSQLHMRQGLAQGGSGLGLAICSRLVELMGGKIDFDSRPGEGSTFRIDLPLQIGRADDLAKAQPGPAPVLPAGLRILLAEDNPTNQLVAQKTLQKLGCTVDIAADGREAVAAAEARPYDVVLMDVSMPGMDGLAATRAIRAALPTGPPILAFTAYAMTDDHQRFRDAGMDGVVAKPISADELIRSIAAVIGERPHAASGVVPAVPAQAADRRASLVVVTTLRGLAESLDPATFAELCRQSQADIGRCVAEIQEAAVVGDLEAVGKASHSLTSVAGTIGAEALSAAAGEINRACRERATLPSASDLSMLGNLAARTLACLRDRSGGELGPDRITRPSTVNA